MARVSLLNKEQVDPAFREMYQRSEEQGREVLNVIKLIANCPQMGPEYFRFAGSVLRGENVPMKLRELATLRVGNLTGADYEFLHHIPLGVSAGLTRKQIDEMGEWQTSSLFDEQERRLPRFDAAGKPIPTLVAYKIEPNPGAGLWRPHNDQLPPERKALREIRDF